MKPAIATEVLLSHGANTNRSKTSKAESCSDERLKLRQEIAI
jgi:hypothetical protein